MMRKWLKEEELLPEDQKLTSQARARYVKVSLHPPPHLPKVIFRDLRFSDFPNANPLFSTLTVSGWTAADMLEKDYVCTCLHVVFLTADRACFLLVSCTSEKVELLLGGIPEVNLLPSTSN